MIVTRVEPMVYRSDLTVVPIDIIQFQRNNLTGPQTPGGRAARERRSSSFPVGFPARIDREVVELFRPVEIWGG